MDLLAKILNWIIITSIWILILYYRRQIKNFIWDFAWAEAYLWRWTSYLILILVWCFMIFFWVVYAFWWLDFLFENQINK